MPVDKWAKYAVPASTTTPDANTAAPATDKWAQYAQPAKQPDAVQKNAGAPWQPIGLPPGTTLPGIPAAPTSYVKPTLLGKDAEPSTATNVAKGVVKGAASTLSHIDDLVAKVPVVGRALTTPMIGDSTSEQAREHLAEMAQTHGTAQAVGKGVEQAAEFLIPGGAEEGAVKALTTGSRFAKYAPLAKAGAAAVGAGVVNKAQGGSFTGGAAAGAAGNMVGQGIAKVAPMLAETALGVRATDRAAGRTPGEAILKETTGSDPGDIADQAFKRVGQDTAALDANAKGSQVPIDLGGPQQAGTPREVAERWLNTANKRNNEATIRDVGKIGEQLDNRGGTPIPKFVSADEGLALRRGIDDLQSNWNPALDKDFASRAVNATRGAFQPQLAAAIPDYEKLNSSISTLMPVAKRAGAADLHAGVAQRVLGRFMRPTGALTGAFGGYEVGKQEGHGTAGGLVGAGLGLFGPEMMTSPTTLMRFARAADSGAVPNFAIPAATGSALNGVRGLLPAPPATGGPGVEPITEDTLNTLYPSPAEPADPKKKKK